jgi:lauroyl/myristoyl acyltransferase
VGTAAGAIGVETATKAARLLARSVFDLNPPARRRMESNLRQALGDCPHFARKEQEARSSQALRRRRIPAKWGLSPSPGRAEAERIARAAFENVASFWVEVLFCRRRLMPGKWHRYVDVADRAAWATLGGEARPALLVTGYLGNPAVAACVLSELVPPVYVLVDPVSRMLIQASGGVDRRFRGLRFIDVRDAPRRVPEVMQAGHRLLVLAGTARRGPGGVDVPFLGHPARHPAAIARLAIRHQAEIVVFHCTRRADPAFSFELRAVDRIRPRAGEATAAIVTRDYLAALERTVRANPEQYLWTRR